MKTSFYTREFETIISLARKGWIKSSGIAYLRSLITWSWVYYYTYTGTR